MHSNSVYLTLLEKCPYTHSWVATHTNPIHMKITHYSTNKNILNLKWCYFNTETYVKIFQNKVR